MASLNHTRVILRVTLSSRVKCLQILPANPSSFGVVVSLINPSVGVSALKILHRGRRPLHPAPKPTSEASVWNLVADAFAAVLRKIALWALTRG